MLGDAVVSGRLDKAVKERGDLGASLAAASVVISPSDNDSPEVSFHSVVVEREATVIDKAAQSGP